MILNFKAFNKITKEIVDVTPENSLFISGGKLYRIETYEANYETGEVKTYIDDVTDQYDVIIGTGVKDGNGDEIFLPPIRK